MTPPDGANAEDLISEIGQHWSAFRDHHPADDSIPRFLEDPLLANLIGGSSNQVIQVIDMRTFKSVYASPNVFDSTGYTPEEINSRGVWQFLKNLRMAELWAHVRNGRLISSVQRGLPPKTRFHSALINSSMKTKQGLRLQIVSQNFTVDWDEAGRQRHHLFLWREATHFFKEARPVWRHRWMPPGQPDVVWSTRLDEERFVNQDLFSQRELEVIGLVRAGLDSKEIAERLGLSAMTVENHRQNALSRLGLKSTDGLIELGAWLKLW